MDDTRRNRMNPLACQSSEETSFVGSEFDCVQMTCYFLRNIAHTAYVPCVNESACSFAVIG